MNAKNITLLPHQLSYSNQASKISLVDALKLIQNNPSKNVMNARLVGKGNEGYEKYKQNSPHFAWGCTFGKSKNNKDIIDYTGLIYADIDEQDIINSKLELLELKQAIFEKYDFVQAIWLSFGGTGLGFLIRCDQVDSHSAYQQGYVSLANKIKLDFNFELKLDASCKSPNRQNAISYDKDILFINEPANYTYIYDPSIKLNSNKGIGVDSSLYKCTKLFDKFKDRFTNYYTSCSWVDKITGLPIIGNKKISYNRNDYALTRHFDFDIINSVGNIHENKHLSYIPESVACTTLFTGEMIKIKQGSRKFYLKSFTLDYLFLREFDDKVEVISKNYIYNVLLALNSTLWDKSGTKKMPLPFEEINALACEIFELFQTKNFLPSCSFKKHIRTKEFVEIVRPRYQPNELGKTIIVNEINSIKERIKLEKVEELLNKLCKNQTPTLKQAVDYLGENYQNEKGKFLETNSFYRIIKKTQLFAPPSSIKSIGGNTMEERPAKEKKVAGFENITTKTKLLSCVNLLLLDNVNITQELISQKSGIPLRTVQYHYKEIKPIIKNHKENMKDNSKQNSEPSKLVTRWYTRPEITSSPITHVVMVYDPAIFDLPEMNIPLKPTTKKVPLWDEEFISV